MINFNSDISVMIAIDPIDFRAGMNKLAAVAQSVFGRNPRNGSLFVFRNKRRTDIKLIAYHYNGFFLGHKRLSKGKLAMWPRTETESLNISSEELIRLLQGVDPRGHFHPEWQKLDWDEQQGRAQTDHDPRGPGGSQRSPGIEQPQW